MRTARPSPMTRWTPIRKRLMDACDWRGLDITPDHIRRAKQAYFANISYIDDKIGEILAVLEATRQEAIIVFLSDHGEMLGENGLWFKMNFFEGSARVPLMIAAPGNARGSSKRRSRPSTSRRRCAPWPGSPWTRSRPGPKG
jgi:choline-sulfatase